MRIKARFEGGVLRPLEEISLTEGSTVEMILIPEAWSNLLRDILEGVRRRATTMSPEEIEAEITRAADEARTKRLAAR